MASYKVKTFDDDTVTVSCGCPGKPPAVIPTWMLIAAADENHDIAKFCNMVGINTKHNRPRVAKVAMRWALDQGLIEAMPQGWA